MISPTSHCRDERHEQNLLLFAHGGLPFPRRGLMTAHLRICPRCREERDRLLSVSVLMAGAVRADAGLALWRPPSVLSSSDRPAAPGRVFVTRPLPAWAVVLVLALLLVGASVAAALAFQTTDGTAAPAADCEATPVLAAPAKN